MDQTSQIYQNNNVLIAIEDIHFESVTNEEAQSIIEYKKRYSLSNMKHSLILTSILFIIIAIVEVISFITNKSNISKKNILGSTIFFIFILIAVLAYTIIKALVSIYMSDNNTEDIHIAYAVIISKSTDRDSSSSSVKFFFNTPSVKLLFPQGSCTRTFYPNRYMYKHCRVGDRVLVEKSLSIGDFKYNLYPVE